MKKRLNLAVVLVSAVIFTLLFYKQSLGINLLIYELAVLSWLSISKQFQFKGLNTIVSFLSVLLTVVFTVIHHSTLSFIINFIVFFVFIGIIISPQINSLLNSIRSSFSNIIASIAELKERIAKSKVNNSKLGYSLWTLRIFLIPFAIILLFSSIYSWANPKFGEIIGDLWSYVSAFFENIDLTVISTFLIGLVVSTYIFLRRRNEKAIKRDINSNESLIRVRAERTKAFKNLALKNEYRSALFLFGSLNVLLLGLNILDIDHVWINFEWQGQFLKQFVHQGTYILIFAIVISILLVLYFFRSNLNFYKKNKALKILCYIWLAQNMILVVSVGIRNWYYIQYFALAYKRIAVVFFLILAIYGLFSVYMKVKGTKSKYYLTKNNAFAWMIVLVISSGFNWDRIIAKYNFENSKKSFVHLNYLSKLSNSALPFLERPIDELEKIDIYQEYRFFLDFSRAYNYHDIYMDAEEYLATIRFRKSEFIQEWESKGVLEWNYAEYRAYHEIMDDQRFSKN